MLYINVTRLKFDHMKPFWLECFFGRDFFAASSDLASPTSPELAKLVVLVTVPPPHKKKQPSREKVRAQSDTKAEQEDV